jgi:SOS-response transcriptional repressor LexA
LPPSAENDPRKSTRWQEVPVIGLAACEVMGWFNPSPLAFRIPLLVDHPHTPELFAVLAVGESMLPEGIREGFVLYCDPGAPLNKNDVVYTESTDGRASIKKFLGQEGEHIVMQGWLDPDADGVQKPFTIKLSKAHIKVLAPVVVIKCKA